jgi:hypothetical protein
MSQQALADYENARKEQLNRNEARRIRMRVSEARKSPHTAGIRWPFELLQNALDAGPRPGRATVTVFLRHYERTVVFEHDAAPFTSLELAALLSGGSSKEFESEQTTGRFGSGFLVTHVLAEKTQVEGLLGLEMGVERFQLVLDRGGDEEAILRNIKACSDAIRAAVPVATYDSMPSAKFEYFLDSPDSLQLGLQSFRNALPYLYGTRSGLGRVTIEVDDQQTEEWKPGPVLSETLSEGTLLYREICVSTPRVAVAREMRVHRFMTRTDAHAAALVLLEKEGQDWRIVIPNAEQPRIYREYPLRGTGYLPINFVLDGKFDPDQERNHLLMSEHDRELIIESINAALQGASKAVSDKRRNAHLLARASAPESGFETTNVEERLWWRTQMASFASSLAAKDIVDTSKGFLPAVSAAGAFADFVVPQLSSTSHSDETSVERLWPLVSSTQHLIPANYEVLRTGRLRLKAGPLWELN